MIDNKTVKKMKEADKLKRNATTKDQMVSALNKINYIRKKNKSNAMKEDIVRRADAKVVKIHTPDGKVVYRKQKPEIKVESAAADIKELALKRDPKQKNLLIPVKGAKGTSKYTRMKAMTKAKEKKESQIDEARPSKDDEEGAEHIIMQLRKSVSLRGNKDVMFQDGSSKKVSMKDAQRALDKYNRMKPMDRIKLQKQYEKDFRSFSQAIK